MGHDLFHLNLFCKPGYLWLTAMPRKIDIGSISPAQVLRVVDRNKR